MCSVLRFSSHPRASTCFSSPRPSPSPAFSRTPRVRNPPPFLFVAYHRLLATKKRKKKKKFSPPKKNLFRQRGAAARTSRPRPRCFSLYVMLDAKRTDFASTREKGVFQFRFRARNGSVFNPGSKEIYFKIFAFNEILRIRRISTNIFRSAMIHGSGTSDADPGEASIFPFHLVVGKRNEGDSSVS